jgi:hypothetical protein
MPNTIRIKRRAAAGAAGAPTTLATAELAFNEADNVLYIGYGDDGSGVATSIQSLAGSGSYVTLGSAQTISGAKTFSTAPLVTDTILASDSSTKVATTAFVKAQSYLTANQTITVTGDVTGSGTTALTLTLANTGVSAGTYTKVTVDTKGRVTSATTLSASDIPTLTASKISDFDTQVRTSRLDQLAAPTADVSFNGYKITNLATPVSSTDAANKGYVDGKIQGLDIKASVRVASGVNVTISSPGATIGGVALTSGDRVLLFGQTTASQNGIYVFNGASSAMTRSDDAATGTVLTANAFVFIEEGSHADTGYVLTTNDTIVVGTTAQTWVQFSSAGSFEAGDGLSQSGSTINVNVDNTSLAIVTDTLQIKSTWPGQTSITTLGTISSGTWQATVVGLQYGGTGANLSGATLGTIFKKGASSLVAAVEGTDYLSSNSAIFGGTF